MDIDLRLIEGSILTPTITTKYHHRQQKQQHLNNAEKKISSRPDQLLNNLLHARVCNSCH